MYRYIGICVVIDYYIFVFLCKPAAVAISAITVLINVGMVYVHVCM